MIEEEDRTEEETGHAGAEVEIPLAIVIARILIVSGMGIAAALGIFFLVGGIWIPAAIGLAATVVFLLLMFAVEKLAE